MNMKMWLTARPSLSGHHVGLFPTDSLGIVVPSHSAQIDLLPSTAYNQLMCNVFCVILIPFPAKILLDLGSLALVFFRVNDSTIRKRHLYKLALKRDWKSFNMQQLDNLNRVGVLIPTVVIIQPIGTIMYVDKWFVVKHIVVTNNSIQIGLH